MHLALDFYFISVMLLKFVTVDRLAAAHRGAIRAMQVFINQLSDPAESKVPTYCKELGQLIRQLSLCSAKVEVGQGSSVPETALDILQKLEVLLDQTYTVCALYINAVCYKNLIADY